MEKLLESYKNLKSEEKDILNNLKSNRGNIIKCEHSLNIHIKSIYDDVLNIEKDVYFFNPNYLKSFNHITLTKEKLYYIIRDIRINKTMIKCTGVLENGDLFSIKIPIEYISLFPTDLYDKHKLWITNFLDKKYSKWKEHRIIELRKELEKINNEIKSLK